MIAVCGAVSALVVILTEGGLTTRWNEVRPVMPLGVVLATLGVAISVGVVACVAHFVLGLDWQTAVLLGAVTSPTDAAAVFSVLRRVPIRPRLRGALEAESGLNDAPTVLLVTLVSTGEVGENGILHFTGLVLYELVVGALFVVAFPWLLHRERRWFDRWVLARRDFARVLTVLVAVRAFEVGRIARAPKADAVSVLGVAVPMRAGAWAFFVLTVATAVLLARAGWSREP